MRKEIGNGRRGMIGLVAAGLLIAGCGIPAASLPPREPKTLTVQVEGKGTVDSDGGTFPAGAKIILNAAPDPGWHFARWDGGVIGINSRTLVVLKDHMTVTAIFEPDEPTTLKVNVKGQGTVDPTEGTFNTTDNVTLKAVPAEDWFFIGWMGGISGTDNVTTVSMKSNLEVTALFAQNLTRVRLETTLGPIVIEVDLGKAPATVSNFLRYVEEGFYDGRDGKEATIFHRVILNFMIQGGGFTAAMNQKSTRDPIPIESNNGLENDRGTVAMARTDNPNSATSQFFINVVDNDFLNYKSDAEPGYAVFGRVIEGMDVADAIVNVQTSSVGQQDDVPVDTITITSAQIVE